MISNFLNPFRPVKFEDEGSPLIYVSDQAMQQFTAGNYFFTGKRGCGKTSILKISDTLFQNENKHLRQSSNIDKYQTTFGVYINLNNRSKPNFFTMRDNKANRKYLVTKESKQELTTYYLELIILHKVVEHCVALRDAVVFEVDDDCERGIASSVCREYGVGQAKNLDHLVYEIEHVLVEMLEFARCIRDDLPSFKTRHENKFHSVMGQVLRALRGHNEHLNQIRILIDDCETFSPEFQAALNTLIRTPRGEPVAWSIAYVDGRYRAAETTIDGQALAREERTIVYLDGLDAADYEKFCTEVTRLRVKRAFPDVADFSIKDKLSAFEIDELCTESFSDTTNKRAVTFLKDFQNRQNPSRKMWEFFLERSGIDGVRSNDALRKKALASYICICAKYRVPMYYAGFKTVVGLSDGCIRDFLEVLGSLYEQVTHSYSDPQRFLQRDVYDIREQDRGCREAATRKLQSISDYAEKNGYYLAKLIPFLGHLVKEFQHDYKYLSALKSPDRAVFSIEMGRNDRYIELIRDAEVDGYVRRVDLGAKQGVYCFRLHRQFAPNFDIAYREPSDGLIPIPTFFLHQINDREVDNPSAWARHVFESWLRKRQNPAQADLLEDEEDER
ncbi:ORC-CDC6 family AAA ATPase [Agrobacterium salinitolerans]|uniref:ORC-CDC6 family AAA ATPase n=1 Tax=Agrobacterium salinitolerans TaxID=1183413 RepID=UPI003FD4B1B7